MNTYIRNKKCAIWAYICKIETLNNKLEVSKPEHFCFVIKPDRKFKYPRNPEALFDILSPLLEKDSFIDISVVGYMNTIQFDFNKKDTVKLFDI